MIKKCFSILYRFSVDLPFRYKKNQSDKSTDKSIFSLHSLQQLELQCMLLSFSFYLIRLLIVLIVFV